MHIPEDLFQFEKEPALVAICGSKTGRVFLAHKGELSQLFFIEHSEIRYSDDEGFFGGKETGGSPEIPVDAMEEKEFTDKFGPAVAKAADDNAPEKIYLFAPSEALPAVLDSLRSGDRAKVVVVKEGNYVDRHPTEALKYITEA